MFSDLPTQVNSEPRASWWQAIFEASEDALLVCGRSGEIHEANPRAQKIFQSAEWDLQRSLFEAVTGPTLHRLKAEFERESKFPEQLSSISFLPYAPLRMVVDLVVSRLDAEHWLITIKDTSRRWRMESHVHRLM